MKKMTGNITLLMVIFIGLLVFGCHFHYIFATHLLMISVFQHFQAWILQHFPRISSWSCLPIYTEDMSCAFAFSPLRGNYEIESFQVYLDRLVAWDIHFNNYVDHRETRAFDDIMLY